MPGSSRFLGGRPPDGCSTLFRSSKARSSGSTIGRCSSCKGGELPETHLRERRLPSEGVERSVPDLDSDPKPEGANRKIDVAILTGGADQPYAYGLANALIEHGAAMDIIGNDELDCPEFHGRPGIN